jgi:FkbM family methyltransferase
MKISIMRRYLASLRSSLRLLNEPDTHLVTALCLICALARLEWHATWERRSPSGTVRFRFLDYDVESFSYTTLLMLFRDIFIARVYDLTLSAEEPIIVDGGANIGMATLYFNLHYPLSRIWAFEPDPRVFELLQRTVSRNNLTNVTIVNAALADCDATIPFYYDEDAPDLLIMSVHEHRLPESRLMVPCLKLSTALPPGALDLLKLDIEGAEGMVMEELASSGKLKDVRRLLIEYHHNIGSVPSRLGDFLSLLDRDGFVYSLSGDAAVPGSFQDLFISAIRITNGASPEDGR